MSHGTQKKKPVEQNLADTLYRHNMLCYLQRLEQKSDNALLNEAFIYVRNHSQFYGLLNSDEAIHIHYKAR